MSLVVDHVQKKYGDFTALHDLSFDFREPGVFALLGTNGAGKTTAIRIILGMLSKDEGTVSWKGKPMSVTEERIGYLAEERGLYPKYTIIEQMLYFAELKGLNKANAKKAIDYWFSRLKIDEYRLKKADQLSKGNQQKIQLAAALIADPELLMLDEPLSGLDPVNAELFKSIIREMRDKGKYIIMSSHQMPTIEEFCEDIVILNKGQMVLSGNLNRIKKSYGRVNLAVKAEGNIVPMAEECGLQLLTETPAETNFKVTDEKQAEALLKKIVAANIPLIKFDFKEPSLQQIFVEAVGGDINED